MNLRHAAALALVGWYLMVPTPYGSADLHYEPNLPLSKWTAFESFETADACGKARYDMQRKTEKDRPDQLTVKGRMAFLAGEAQCIATDDPRLAEGVSHAPGGR